MLFDNAKVVEKEKDSAFDFSIDQAQRLLGKGVEVAGKFTGIEGMEQFGADVVAQQEKDIEEGGYTPEYQGSLREAYQQGGIDNALGWLKEKSIENVVSSGTAIVGTGLAAITAPFSIPASLAITGATIGSSVLMGAGESAQEMEDKTGTYDANVAVGVGALVGILDKFGAGKVIPKGKLSNMTGEELITALAKAGKPEAGKAIAARIGKATAGEAGTEALQESAIMGGAALTGGEYTGMEIADKIIDSAALGGTMGGATRGAGELVNVAGRTSPSSLVDRAKGQMEDIFRGPDDTSGLALAGDVPSDALQQQQQEDETTAKAQIDEMMIGEGTVSGDEGAKQWREKAKEAYTQRMSDIQEDADINVLESDYRLFQNLKDEDKRSIFKETGAYVDEIDGQIKTEIPSYNAELDETVLNDEQFFTVEKTMTGPIFKVKTRQEQADYLGIDILTVGDLRKIPMLRVRDILKFPEFYEQYDKEMVGEYGVTYQPIGDIPVSLETNRMAGGSYSPSFDTINLMPSQAKFMKETLLHELQHAIQHRHGFAQGDSPVRYLPENVDTAKEKIQKEIQQGATEITGKLSYSPLTREKYREYKDSSKYTNAEVNERLQTIIYALANRTVSQPSNDASIVSKELSKKKMPKVLPSTIDGPAISYDVQKAYEDSVDDLQKLYDIFSPSDKVRFLQKFVNLSVLNHRLDTAEKIASLTYRLASGELESTNVENRHRIILEKYIKEGKNPDKALRELYPTDTRGLPKSFVNYFRSPQYKNISKLGQFTDEELLAPDNSSGLFGSRRDSTEKIINLNKALSFDTENIDDFINKLKEPKDKIDKLRLNMALKLSKLDKLESVFLGRTSTQDKPIQDEEGRSTGIRMNFSIALSELSARLDQEYEFYKSPISPPSFVFPAKTDKEQKQRLEEYGDLTEVEKVGKIVSEVKEKLFSSGLDNITTEIEKLIASFYLGYPIRVGSESENVVKLGIKRPEDVPSDAQASFIVAPNSIINTKINEYKALSKDKKLRKKLDIADKIKFSYKGLLKPIKNKSKDIYNFRYTAPSDLDEIAYLYKKIQEVKKETPQDITTIDDSYGIDIEQSMVGYPVTEDDIDSRTMFINEAMRKGGTELSEAREGTVSDKEQALELLKNPDAIAEWKKNNKVSKEELKRRTTRKYIEQTEALQQGKMSGKEYRDFIRTNQPATKFEANDLPNLFASYTDAVGALKPSFSAKGIVGLTTEIPEGTIVDSRLDIDGYNLYNTWIASIKTPDGNKYGRTAVLKDVKFSVSGKNPVDKTLAVAQGKAEKSPFAVMKGEWQNLSDEEAYSLAETYINNPDYVQVGFNPERHSFFYRKDNMMPVFEAEEVVQVGALVLAKLKKENPVERIGKLRGLKIKSRQDGKPATFNEGGIPMKKDIQAQQLEMFGDVGKMAKKKMSNDPISGNEIPKGSVAEEVRDDIPAQLSEGEFVLPADVVRYHGLEKLMKLRQEAKGGINMMDSMGQMGNSEEATMSDDMPFKPQMAVGGAVPGIKIGGAVASALSGKPNVEPYGTPDFPVDDPYATAADYEQVGLEPINIKEQYARQAGYASLADMSANLGGDIIPTFKRGTKPGEVSMDTGYTFNAAGESRADDGTVAYSSFQDFVDNMKASVKSGWHGGAGYTKSQYNALSDKAKENYKNHVSILSGVKGKDITPSYLKTTVDPKAITTIKDSREAREEEKRKQEEEKRQRALAEAQRKAGEARRAAEAQAKRQEIEATNRAMQDTYRQAGFDTITADDGDTGGDYSTDTGSVSEGGYGGIGATAKGGFIKKKVKAKKMKQGGLASRR